VNKSPAKKGGRRFGLLAMVLLIAAGFLAAHHFIHALYPLRYSSAVERYCEEFGIDTDLAYAVIHTESGFDPEARSDVGALGLMQIMPDTFMWLQNKLEPDAGRSADALFDPEINIRYGVYYLSMLRNMFGDDTLAIAAYHAGQNRVSRWLSEKKISAENCTAEDIPSSATGHYVHKVERARRIYRGLYENTVKHGG